MCWVLLTALMTAVPVFVVATTAVAAVAVTARRFAPGVAPLGEVAGATVGALVLTAVVSFAM